MTLNAETLPAPVPIAERGAVTGRLDRLRDRAAIVAMVCGNMFNILALVVVSPLVAAIAAHFAQHAQNDVVLSLLGFPIKTELASQLMITLLNIGIMFAGPLLGLLAEKVGYARLLPAALAVYAVSGSAGLYLDSPASLLFSRLVLGLAAASISIACYSLIGARFQGAARARVLGYQSALVMATGLVALFGSGAIASAGGWRAPFALYLLAIPMFCVALFAASGARPDRAAGTAPRAGMASLWPLWPLYLALIPFNIVAYMTAVHLPFVLVTDGVVDPSNMGLIMASSFLMNILTSLCYSRIAARLSRRWIFVLVIGLFAASDLIIGAATGWIGTTIGCWVAGLGGGLMTPFFVNTILNRAPEAARARAIGLMYTMMYVGDFINPVVITPLRHQLGNHEIFGVVGLAVAAAALIQALSRRTPLGPENQRAIA
jgi:MFS family permease